MEKIKAKKIEMTQVFGEDGSVIAVTKLQLLQSGSSLNVSDIVNVSGNAKGKGFAGVVKRHGFAGGPKTHGQSDRHRAPGSIGAGTDPGRVWKGQKMAGRMGGKKVTVKNLEVISVNGDELLLKGGVPGSRNSVVEIRVVSPAGTKDSSESDNK